MAPSDPRVVVIGAGAFGGWTAFELNRRGARVTLLDAWGAGHARASSGGETRVIRAAYGSRVHYTRMAIDALRIWREHEAGWRQRLLHETGVLWMFGDSEAAAEFARASEAALRGAGAPLEVLTTSQASRRYPQVSFSDIAHVLFEPDAGYLMARRSCRFVIEQFAAEGGEYRLAAAANPSIAHGGRLERLPLRDGRALEADAFVFACGPWLPAILPDVIGDTLTATRQEVHYFGTPAGDHRFTSTALPVWIDYRQTQFYGVPGDGHRGFKVADDAVGPLMDPTTSERNATPGLVDRARAFLRHRFPDLGDVPLVGSEVCQYESSPDAEFIIDRHPAAENVWIAGGGSGHGFKMGPVVGQMLASHVLGDSEPDPRYRLSRFVKPPPAGWPPKWT